MVTINKAGKLILEICKERNLFVANMMFDHKQAGLGTSKELVMKERQKRFMMEK